MTIYRPEKKRCILFLKEDLMTAKAASEHFKSSLWLRSSDMTRMAESPLVKN